MIEHWYRHLPGLKLPELVGRCRGKEQWVNGELPENLWQLRYLLGFPGGSVVKNQPANTGASGDTSSFPGLGRSPGEGNGKPLQYSCQCNPMDWVAWQATQFLGSQRVRHDWECSRGICVMSRVVSVQSLWVCMLPFFLLNADNNISYLHTQSSHFQTAATYQTSCSL